MPPSLPEAEAVLSRWFGYSALRPPQRRAIAAVLARRDALVVMPTGGGKSLCFQVPALMLDGLTVVLSPLISLMKDQVDTLVRKGVPAAGIHGGMTPGEQADAIARAVRGEVKMLYVAPERLVAGHTLRALARLRVALLAVDEAHCISEWGHEFRPAYREVQTIRGPIGDPPVIALTATATPAVRDDIIQVCRLRNPVHVTAGFDRPNLSYRVRRVARPQDRNRRIVELAGRRSGGAVVVYAQTRSRVERLAATLRSSGTPAVPYHGGQPQDVRRATQERFMRGEVNAIVATSAFGMGVDKADVRLVVHDAISASLESYYQEAGRAGRDGNPSECVLLYARADRRSPEYFIASGSPPREVVERVYAEAAAGARRATPGFGPPPVNAGAIAARLKLPPAQVTGALTILTRSGAMTDERGEREAVWVRLTGTDARIASLPGRSLQRELLRAMWRLTRGGIRGGAIVRLDALPPGLGGANVAAELDALVRESLLVWARPGAGTRVVDANAPMSRWPIDWAGVEARRRVAEARLAAMIRYAETRGCRRQVLLGYFGDAVEGGTCGKCDRCE